MPLSTILSENRHYWTGRSAGYSKVNRTELATAQREKWKSCLYKEIAGHFPGKDLHGLRVLDVGTGPGFFAILLCEMGLSVTAVDLTPAMLEEARRNAGNLAEKIRFLEMNAEELDFPDDSFDVIVSRNLTWNLPHPEKAYAEWSRVLGPGGLLLNFDANWYSYLFDTEALSAYEADRERISISWRTSPAVSLFPASADPDGISTSWGGWGCGRRRMSPSGKKYGPGRKKSISLPPPCLSSGRRQSDGASVTDLNIRTRILPDNIKRQQIGIPVFEIPICCLFCGMDTL